MHLTILTADLLPPLQFALAYSTPHLDALMQRSNVSTSTGVALEVAVQAAFNNHDGAASLTALVDMPNENGNWLRADPVHFAVSRDNIQLFDSHVVKPTLDEMTAIAATLNKHFYEDGLVFTFPDAARGYVSVALDDVPETTPLWQMGGANVFEHLPRHENCRTNWRGVGNEIQMLLHEHPVNIEREKNNQRPINGLWIWGGCNPTNSTKNEDKTSTPSFPRRRESKSDQSALLVGQNLDSRLRGNDGSKKNYQHLIGRLAIARGLAKLNGLTLAPLPDKFVLPTIDNSLIVLHAPTREIRSLSPYQWQLEVKNIDDNWIASAVAAFDDKRLTTLTIIIANEKNTLTIQVNRKSLLNRFFPTKKALADYA